MDDAQFWTIVGESYRPDSVEQAEALKVPLAALPWFEVLAFQAQFEAKAALADTEGLRMAALLINGDASERGFRNFRLGLVAFGRRAYEAAVADADVLADFLDGDPVDGYGLDKVAVRVYEEKTGGSDFFEKLAEAFPHIGTPVEGGTPRSDVDIRQALPRLAEMYPPDEGP